MTKFSNDFSRETWELKYSFGDATINDTFDRVSTALASVEKDKEKWSKEFRDVLEDFKFVPGGRILSNAGTGLKGTTLTNCFVSGFQGEDRDSIEGIYAELGRQALILKSEGGYGFCADTMRPRGSNIHGIANQSPGAVQFLDLWNVSSTTITSGSGHKPKAGEKKFIRKGAQMVTMSCWHPDVEEFITAKQTEGRLEKFNMSVLCTDEFMHAVENDEEWKLQFPNYSAYPELYKEVWDGDILHWQMEVMQVRQEGEPDGLVTYKVIQARDLWNLIMDSTYNRNEPGVLFVDTINSMNNLSYCEHISATNPCAEQCFPPNNSCLLGSFNLVNFIDTNNKEWNYPLLEEYIYKVVRFMDNVVDVTNMPLPEIKEEALNKRRIGLGVFGYASALLMCRVKYGSKKALEMAEDLMEFLANTAYLASVELAKEKGPFPAFDRDKYCQSRFIKKLKPEVQKAIYKYGIRNSHLLSIQPTGNTSVVSNLASSSQEPCFTVPGYFRTAIVPYPPEGLIMPKHINWDDLENTYCFDDNHFIVDQLKERWSVTKEGDEEILITKFDDQVYKIDRNRGLTRENWIEDYGVTYLKQRNKWNPDAKWAKGAMGLTVEDHINTMTIFANWVDASISKTINVVNDYSYEDFKNIYMRCWKAGIKGFTTYREGTMTSVLSQSSSLKNKEGLIKRNEAPKRPKEVPCEVYHITAKGEPYCVLVGMLEEDPYEVFAFRNGYIDKKIENGIILKKGRPKCYKAVLDDNGDEMEICPLGTGNSPEENAITRLTSMSLRHGASVQYIVDQLNKTEGFNQGFAKAIAKALKKYVPDGSASSVKCPSCGKKDLIFQEGCHVCKACAFSGCS